MSTVIYPSPIFGPVKSRRLGVSLGINLMPADGKICSFNCVYCECGFNEERRPHSKRPTREEVRNALCAKLTDMQAHGPEPDVLTFAGNGEPTAHPDFANIIDDTLSLRDRFFPKAKVSVLSNATFIHRDNVFKALLKVDNNIQKLDTVNRDYIGRTDRPTGTYDVPKTIARLVDFQGHVIIQTMFMKGNGFDNTADSYVLPWIEALKKIKPASVMIYTIDRETPMKGLEKASREELDGIAHRVIEAGLQCTTSY